MTLNLNLVETQTLLRALNDYLAICEKTLSIDEKKTLGVIRMKTLDELLFIENYFEKDGVIKHDHD